MVVNSILRNKYEENNVLDDLDEDIFEDELDGLESLDEGLDESIMDEDMDEENYQVIKSFSEYDKNDINEILDGLKPKKYKVELGKSIVLLEYVTLFEVSIDRQAYTFLRYFTEQYS